MVSLKSRLTALLRHVSTRCASLLELRPLASMVASVDTLTLMSNLSVCIAHDHHDAALQFRSEMEPTRTHHAQTLAASASSGTKTKH